MLGESTGNVMDARADESLYKPTELGRLINYKGAEYEHEITQC